MSKPTGRPRGRPSVGPELRGVRVEQDVFDRIERIAEVTGSTRAEVVRELLDEALAARALEAARGRNPDSLVERPRYEHGVG